jgi:predicted PurR-regulated permease PerM
MNTVSVPAPPGPPEPAGQELVLHLGPGRQLPRWFWRAIVAVAVSVAAYQFGRGMFERLTGFITILALSLFLSFAVEPAVNHLADRGWRRSRATLFCFFVLFAGFSVFTFVMGELVVRQVTDLVDKSPGYIEDATDWINDAFGSDITTDDLTAQLDAYQEDLAGLAQNVGGRVLSLTGSLVGILFQGLTVALFSYYMTSQGPQLRRNVCSVLPQRNQRTVLLLWELAIQKTGGWIYSRLVLASISAVATWIFLAALGVPSPLALALWVGLISQFIPAIGTYLAGALPVLIALLNDPVDAIWVIGFILVYQQVENYLLSPRITAQTMDLHPAVAFGAAIAGGTLLGPVGAIMALPLAGVIQAFVSTFLQRHEVIDSHLTELEEIEQSEGQQALRRALKRFSRGERDDLGRPAGQPPRDPMVGASGGPVDGDGALHPQGPVDGDPPPAGG